MPLEDPPSFEGSTSARSHRLRLTRPLGVPPGAPLAFDGHVLHVGDGNVLVSHRVDDRGGVTTIARTELPGAIRFVLAVDGEAVVAHASSESERGGDQVSVVRDGARRPLRSLDARALRGSVAGRRIALLVDALPSEPAKVLVMDHWGRIKDSQPVRDRQARVRLAADGTLYLAEPSTGTVRRAKSSACEEPRPRPRHPGPTRPRPEPCPCREPEPDEPHDHGDDGTDGDPDLCRPGDDVVPERCWVTYAIGRHVVRVNVCEPEQPDCSVELGATITRLERMRSALAAVLDGGRRLVILDATTLEVLEERSLRRAPRLLASPESDRLLVIDDVSGAAELVNTSPLSGPAAGFAALTAPAAEFEGQGGQVSLWDTDGPKSGHLRVLVVPFLDKGQSFEGSLATYAQWLQSNFFDVAAAYWHEASYGDIEDITFRVFGVDPHIQAGPPPPPPTLDAALADFYHPAWDPGHLLAEAAVPTAPVAFAGAQTMGLEAIPHDGPTHTRSYTVRFPAASLRLCADQPTTVTFDPAASPPRRFVLTGTARDGSAFTVDASSALLAGPRDVIVDAATLDSPAGVATDLAEVLDDMLQAATPAALQPLFAPPEVTIHRGDRGLALIHITFAFAPGPGGQDPVCDGFTVHDLLPELVDEREGDGGPRPIPGFFDFSATGTAPALQRYLERNLADASAAHPDEPKLQASYLDFVVKRPSVEEIGGLLRIRINLSINHGRKPGTIAGGTPAGPSALGLDQPTAEQGVDISYSSRSLPKDYDALYNALFTAMVDAAFEYVGGEDQVAALNGYLNCVGLPAAHCGFSFPHAFLFTTIAPPPPELAGYWSVGGAQPSEPPEGLRASAKGVQAKYVGDKATGVLPLGANRSKVSMFFKPGTAGQVRGQAATLTHELGHALMGLGDLYRAQGYRDDLRYMGGYDLMHTDDELPHVCGFNKRSKGWLDFGKEPSDKKDVLIVDKPAEANPITDLRVVLVALEHWNPDWPDATREQLRQLVGAAPGTPVVAGIVCRLGGDGYLFDIVELRAKGPAFSSAMDPPRLLIYNAIDERDDTRYAAEQGDDAAPAVFDPFRRRIHLIDDSIRQTGDRFDLAFAKEFPEVGLTVEALDWLASGPVVLALVRLDWTKGRYIDLGFTENTPTWSSPDIGVDAPPYDWPVDEGFPIGEPVDQGDTVRKPPLDAKPNVHRVFVRVWNFGDANARNVVVHLYKKDPHGAGDWSEQDLMPKSDPIEVIEPSIDVDRPATVMFEWPVTAATSAHVCFRAQIGDRDVEQLPGGAAASDDSKPSNNRAQQNVFDIPNPYDSPPEPVEFTFSIYNDGPLAELVRLQPRRLPPGVRLKVVPATAEVQPASRFHFRVRATLDERLIEAPCGKDVTFLLEALRQDDHHEERWGASRYTIRPRQRTTTVVEGVYFGPVIWLSGRVEPETVGAAQVRLHVHIAGEDPFWHTIVLGDGATFSVELPAPSAGGETAAIAAYYDGSPDFAPSVSDLLELEHTFEG